ncbi:MAG: peptidase M14 [Magnetococcales bacterium]|nr:peptidase M14 [Magnetococcales bacterium]
MLTIRDHFPAPLLSTPAHDLHKFLPGPTLCHLPGINPRPLFVSVLLHGNETTGFVAIQNLLSRHSGRPLPRALSILIGNVAAARDRRRHLEGQPDFNRIWCGEGGAEFIMAGEVLSDMVRREVFAAIDIHNNSAANPEYAMVARLAPCNLALGRMFSDKLVFFLQPQSSLTSAFADHCPAVTIECGLPDNPQGVERSVRFLDRLLRLESIPADPGPLENLDLFQIVAMLKVPGERPFGFDPNHQQDLCFLLDPPRQNFQRLPEGTVFALDPLGPGPILEVVDRSGADVAHRFFRMEGSRLITTRPFVPAMLTLDQRIIRQDCLGYILERVRHFPIDAPEIVDRRKRQEE